MQQAIRHPGGTITWSGLDFPDDMANRHRVELQVLSDRGRAEIIDAPSPHPAPREAQALIAAGIEITSSGNPTLNGTYPMDREAERRIGGLLDGLSNGLGLPKGAATVPYAEVDGTPHLFSATEIRALAAVMRDYAFDIEQVLGLKLAGQPAAWPALPIAIG
jgi:hypothetical protein